MISRERLQFAYLAIMAISWGGLVYLTYLSVDAFQLSDETIDIELVFPIARRVCIFFLFISAFLYFKIQTGGDKIINFSELIWSGFVTAALMFVGLLITQQTANIEIIQYLKLEQNLFFKNLVYLISLLFIIVFLSKTFFVFKKMIMYQKTKSLIIYWNFYESLLYLSAFLLFFKFELGSYIYVFSFISINLFGLILSLNMKWVAYLNFKQKLSNILLLLLIFLMGGTMIHYLIVHSSHFVYFYNAYVLNDISIQPLIISGFFFVMFYCFASILVLLFNLPTSSVFEQKIGEVLNYQKLSNSLQTYESEEQIYEVLLDAAVSTTMADAAWLEIIDEKGSYVAFIVRDIEKFDVFEIKKFLKKNGFSLREDNIYVRNTNRLKENEVLKDLHIRSLLLVPLQSKKGYIGTIGLIKNVSDAFNTELIKVVSSFTGQATVSILNSRLIKEAISHERYKEELKIAQNVQKSLLPTALTYSSQFQISVYSNSADDVGGDYYDSYKICEDKVAIVIADVSGHGTTAAFNMAQLKGVFHSVIQLDLPLEQTINLANSALSRCLEKKTFITLTLFIIDQKNKKIQLCRAGHCPTLFYNSELRKANYFENKGLGIGIVRNKDFGQYLETVEHSYKTGDVLLLYTDGVVEAKDSRGDEFGYDNLKISLEKCAELDSQKIVNGIINDIHGFSQNIKLDDDYTCLAIKFVS